MYLVKYKSSKELLHYNGSVLSLTCDIDGWDLLSIHTYEPPRGKTINVVSNESDTNQAVQSQKQARKPPSRLEA